MAVAACAAVAAVAVVLPPPARADARRPLEPMPGAGRVAPRDGPWGGAMSSPGPPAPIAAPIARCQGPGELSGTLNLNLATQEELERLPGIGPAKAKRILEWRARHARFRHVRDLRRVKGFGRKTVLRLAPYLTVDGSSTLQGGER
ncbi:MAG TPA: ComEA family DNA-binding protein [Kofleriaceae bacterium]|nr:ComEA family DNA-binding protein [Kofleriaceae bacterium]